MDGSNVGGGSGDGRDNVTDIQVGRRNRTASTFPVEDTNDISFDQIRKAQFESHEALLARELHAADGDEHHVPVAPVVAEVEAPGHLEAHDAPRGHVPSPANDPGNVWADSHTSGEVVEPVLATANNGGNNFTQHADDETAGTEPHNTTSTNNTVDPNLSVADVNAGNSQVASEENAADAPRSSAFKTSLPDNDDPFVATLHKMHKAVDESSKRLKSDEQIKVEHLQRELDIINGVRLGSDGKPMAPDQKEQKVSSLAAMISSLSRRGKDDRGARQQAIQQQILEAQRNLGNEDQRTSILRSRVDALHGAREAMRTSAISAARQAEVVNQALASTPQGAQHIKEMENVAGMLGTTPEGLRARMANTSDPDPYVQALRQRSEQLRSDPALAGLSAQSTKVNAEYERALSHAESMRDGADFLSRNGVDVSALGDMHRTVEQDMSVMDGVHSPLLDPQKADFAKRTAEMAEEMRKSIEIMVKRLMALLERLLTGSRPALGPTSTQPARPSMAAPAPPAP